MRAGVRLRVLVEPGLAVWRWATASRELGFLPPFCRAPSGHPACLSARPCSGVEGFWCPETFLVSPGRVVTVRGSILLPLLEHRLCHCHCR